VLSMPVDNGDLFSQFVDLLRSDTHLDASYFAEVRAKGRWGDYDLRD